MTFLCLNIVTGDNPETDQWTAERPVVVDSRNLFAGDTAGTAFVADTVTVVVVTVVVVTAVVVTVVVVIVAVVIVVVAIAAVAIGLDRLQRLCY